LAVIVFTAGGRLQVDEPPDSVIATLRKVWGESNFALFHEGGRDRWVNSDEVAYVMPDEDPRGQGL
jgi:hypothetical protein